MNKQLKLNVKIGDKVKVLSGNNKGLIGVITNVSPKNGMVIIDGILPRIKYSKSAQGGTAEKKEISQPVHSSSVMLWDSEANQSSKIGYKFENNVKKRYFKKSGNLV